MAQRQTASWLELFYDVGYIALVAQLTYLATDNHDSISDILHIGIIGYSIFVAWWSTTANRNMQPSESTVDKLFIQLQMVGAFMMSVAMPGVFEGSYTAFFITLALVRFLQAFMLGRMYYVHPDTRPKTYNILEGIVVATGLWVVAAMAPVPYHFLFALLALLVDILLPLTRGKGNTKRYLNVYHLHERLGLFLILVIGESMIVVALSNTATELRTTEPVVLFSGLGLMGSLWWLYFQHSEIYEGVRPKNLFVYLHSHALLFGSIILVSVGYRLVLGNYNDASAVWFLTLGALGMGLAIIIIRFMLHAVCMRALLLTGGIALLAVLLAIGALFYVPVYEVMITISALFILVAILDRWSLFSTRSFTRP